MVKIGDIVCWKPKTAGKIFDADRGCFVDVALYMIVEQILNPPGTTGNYLLGRGYDFKTGKATSEVYDFWEEEVTVVDMKGAYI